MAQPSTSRRWITRAVGAVAGIMLASAFGWFVHSMMSAKSGKPERKVQVVELIRLPPPPPPPPDKPPPPPPPKTEEPLPKDVPEPAPKDEPAPSQPLGLDATGAAGSDAFGLAARLGGSDLIGGNGGAVFAWYTNRLKDAVIQRLSNDPHLGQKHYSLAVSLWLQPDGHIKQVKLLTTTGNPELDQRIEADLPGVVLDAPPIELPQPISVRIVARG